MKWIDKTNDFEKREWKDKYLEICEVLDDKIEVNLYSCKDIENYEIYVSYGVMYGIIYTHKDNAVKLREEIKKVIYDDYLKNGYSDDMPTDEFINNFYEKYHITIPSDIFFDETEFMNKMMNLFDSFDNFDDLI
jgi:hypothetical protein